MSRKHKGMQEKGGLRNEKNSNLAPEMRTLVANAGNN